MTFLGSDQIGNDESCNSEEVQGDSNVPVPAPPDLEKRMCARKIKI
jgi:hypothetical protein